MLGPRGRAAFSLTVIAVLLAMPGAAASPSASLAAYVQSDGGLAPPPDSTRDAPTLRATAAALAIHAALGSAPANASGATAFAWAQWDGTRFGSGSAQDLADAARILRAAGPMSPEARDAVATHAAALARSDGTFAFAVGNTDTRGPFLLSGTRDAATALALADRALEAPTLTWLTARLDDRANVSHARGWFAVLAPLTLAGAAPEATGSPWADALAASIDAALSDDGADVATLREAVWLAEATGVRPNARDTAADRLATWDQDRGAFSASPGNAPLWHATADALAVLAGTSHAVVGADREALVAYLGGYEAATGGFSPIPGPPATVRSTADGLAAWVALAPTAPAVPSASAWLLGRLAEAPGAPAAVNVLPLVAADADGSAALAKAAALAYLAPRPSTQQTHNGVAVARLVTMLPELAPLRGEVVDTLLRIESQLPAPTQDETLQLAAAAAEMRRHLGVAPPPAAVAAAVADAALAVPTLDLCARLSLAHAFATERAADVLAAHRHATGLATERAGDAFPHYRATACAFEPREPQESRAVPLTGAVWTVGLVAAAAWASRRNGPGIGQ